MSTAKRDRQRANRAAKVAAQQAEARRRRNRAITIAVVGLAAIAAAVWILLSFTGDENPSPTTAAAGQDLAPEYVEYLAQPTACGAAPPGGISPMTFEAPGEVDLSGAPTATIQTSCGPVEIALDAQNHPETVDSFAFLAQEGYFDGTACHRVISGFMIQCGDPTASGTGGPGYVVPDEFPPDGFTYERGVVAMANAGAGSTGSQFFIVTGDASHLPASYSILGEVVDGWEALEAIEAVPVEATPTGELSDPQESVYLESVTVEG